MKKLVQLFFIGALILSVNSAYSQLELSAFNQTGSAYAVTALTDYQSLGVNPANLGWTRNDHKMNIGLIENAYMVYSEPLTKKQLTHDLFGGGDPFANDAERQQAVKNFTDALLMMRGSTMFFGISWQDEKIGGFAFQARQRIMWRNNINQESSSFLFNGWNDPYFDIQITDEEGNIVQGQSSEPLKASVIYAPSIISHVWYNEYILGYGRKFVDKENFKFYAGIDLKLIQGFGTLRVEIQDDYSVNAYSALNPIYQVEYNEPTPSKMTGDGLQTAGMGYGMDIGLTFEVQSDIKISLALNDLGQIKWDGNVYEGIDVDIEEIESGGLNSYNIFDEADGIMADNTNYGGWIGLKDNQIKLPMSTRIGASYNILKVEEDEMMLDVGLDVLVPLEKEVPGSYIKPVIAFGVGYEPAEWVRIGVGFVQSGEFGTNIPLGVTFRPVLKENVTWEIGVASRDFTSLFKQNNPNLSIAFGFLRFSFGEKKEAEKRYLDN